MNERQKTFDFFSIQREIEKNIIKPIYLFYGEDNFLHNIILEKLKLHLFRQKRQVNYSVFYGEDLDFSELANSLYAVPLGFGPGTIQGIIIKQLEKIKRPLLQKLDTLIENLSFDSDNHLILLFVDSKAVPKNIKIEKIKKYGSIVNLKKLNKTQIRQLVIARCKEEQKEITNEALYYLQSITENDVGLISNELDKLFCYLEGTSDKITKNDVLNGLYGLRSGNIFDFVEALGERDAARAIGYLRKLLGSDEYHPLQLLAMIHRQIGLIHRAKLFPNNIKIIKGDSNLPYFMVQRIIAQSQKYSLDELKMAYQSLLQAETNLKTGSLLPSLILEQLVIGITKKGSFNPVLPLEQPVP